MIKLYENIRELRKLNHWTQEELAVRMGYTDRSMIAKIESGKVDISQSKIMEFARIFNVEPGDLMGWEDSEVYITTLQEERDSIAKAKELYKMYENVSPEVQQAVELMLKSAQPKP